VKADSLVFKKCRPSTMI